MSTNEYSVGPLYLATEESNQKWFRPHLAEIVEMCEPYRTGKAVILPTGWFKLLAVGFWTRDIYDDVIEDFSKAGWPDWMQHWEVDEEAPRAKWLQGRPLTKDELDALTTEEDPRGVEES